MTEAPIPDVYELAELYDLVFESLDFDIPFWLSVGREARGPVLDLGCGTGRVLLPMLEAGVDADGVDLWPAMLERARVKAQARGFKPRLVAADMRDFTMPRRYARAICAFNSFAHADTPEAQIDTLRCVREHLESGGALVLHMSYPAPSYWAEPDGEPMKELEVRNAERGTVIQLWDTRAKDVVNQLQRSSIEYRELDAAGAVVASHYTQTAQRWVYRRELELLFRLAGFSRWEIHGGFAGEPLERPDQQIVAWAWRD